MRLAHAIRIQFCRIRRLLTLNYLGSTDLEADPLLIVLADPVESSGVAATSIVDHSRPYCAVGAASSGTGFDEAKKRVRVSSASTGQTRLVLA